MITRIFDLNETVDEREWKIAVDGYRLNESAHLESMLCGDAPIPTYVRLFLASIASGEQKIDRRGKGKKADVLTYRDRKDISEKLSAFRALLREGIDSKAIANNYNESTIFHGKTGVPLIDAGDVKHSIDERIAAIITTLATKHGTTEAAIKKADAQFKKNQMQLSEQSSLKNN